MVGYTYPHRVVFRSTKSYYFMLPGIYCALPSEVIKEYLFLGHPEFIQSF